ncbi:hypothetical protein [Saccharospirillum salsuginis]|uniref:Outer membrane protein beta-barrel domain-containing protein n=1 Tax=Saccharospirillum salsuginis TaxID=418750 RepID=A0A918KTI9_9GAMM|nr:hypothetical protein [Saccharospirillum salsuginis]GGX73231.1 hypothetical protein GCM10007392_45800 [Saccharospirillum salsuginis]
MANKLIPALMALCALTLSLPVYASNLGLQFQTGRYAIDSEVAEREGIEDSGFSLGFDAYTVLANHVRLGGGFFTVFTEDHESYSVMVEDQNGNVSEADSSAAVGSFYGEAGLTARPLPWLVTDLTAGYGVGLSTRTVSNCMDCPGEKLDVPIGAYIKPRVSYVHAMTDDGYFNIGLEYVGFLGESGMENGIMLNLGLFVDF